VQIDAPQHPLLKKARKARALATLRVQNRVSRRSILGDAPVAVSLTTYGYRFATVAYAIESIARGPVRPRRFILWVDEAEAGRADRPDLDRLRARGLEIRSTADYGAHKKNYPFARDHADDGLAMVTADDDIIYPRGWLAGLVDAHAAHPDSFVAYRAHEMALDGATIAPYKDWRPAGPGTPANRAFVTGGAGAVFPSRMMRRMREAGDDFLRTCPRADDIWINVMALRSQTPTVVVPTTASALGIPGVQQKGNLHEGNVHGGNDEQIRATYTAEDIASLSAVGGER
jgi:hypothetical protein